MEWASDVTQLKGLDGAESAASGALADYSLFKVCRFWPMRSARACHALPTIFEVRRGRRGATPTFRSNISATAALLLHIKNKDAKRTVEELIALQREDGVDDEIDEQEIEALVQSRMATFRWSYSSTF